MDLKSKILVCIETADACLELKTRLAPALVFSRTDQRAVLNAEFETAQQAFMLRKSQLLKAWLESTERARTLLKTLSPNGSLPPAQPPAIKRFFEAFDALDASLDGIAHAIAFAPITTKDRRSEIGINIEKATDAYQSGKQELINLSHKLAADAAELLATPSP